MKEQIEVIKGTKIESTEAAKLDRNKMGVLITAPPQEGEVTGQHWADAYSGYTQCPWCGNIGRSTVHSTHYEWYTCGRCGRSFRA